jgi:glycosyltransferase involved in cell wall biosynthesis
MKVALWPSFNPRENGEGGIRRVWEALNKYLPENGVEIVQRIEDADVVNVHADWIKTDKPIAYSSHGLYWASYDWPKWAIHANDKLIKALRYSHSLSVPSQFVHNVFARGALLDPFVLPHGIDIHEWEPKKSEGYVFWGKTRVDPICDPEPVNKLAALCPDIRFVSTFGNPDLSNVTLTGHLTYKKAKATLSRASVYLATVKETGGITVLEALASGIPALGFDWGVNREIITHKETGYLVPVGDYTALREGLLYINQHRERLSANARQFVQERHQWRDRIRDYIPFYEAAISKATPSSGPKVSIIVTAYNLEKYLSACLDSVLYQDFNSWECIVVDDNSPDHCGRIAEEYAKKDKRFRVLHNSCNQYLAEARNIGIRSSKGQYILPLDADDELGTSTLRILSEALDKNRNLDIVTGSFQLIEPTGERWVSDWPPEIPNYDEQIRFHNQLPYASMYRRWVWEYTGGYRRRWRSAEDAEFWTRAMSYGAVPAKVTNRPTLVYNNRPNSMSHTIATPNWTAWFPWSYLPDTTPFSASHIPSESHVIRPVLDYDPIIITVVIPCGPGHEGYLQDALDSLVAQTYQNWEAVVINDTGKKWFNNQGDRINPHIAGYPYVTFLDCEVEGKSTGPAKARNRGIAVAKGRYVVFLDADDFLQPLALYYMYQTIKKTGGWVYGDWFDHEGNYKEAREFSVQDTLAKMPCSITCIFPREALLKVGGFDETAPGWEDYDLILSLIEHDECPTHLKFPIFTYRYLSGIRREENYAREKELISWIKNKHKDLYDSCL